MVRGGCTVGSICYGTAMNTQQYHQLSSDEQEKLRRKAVEAVVSGQKQIEVARLFGVTRQAVNNWMMAYRAGGMKAIRTRKKGRPRGPAERP